MNLEPSEIHAQQPTELDNPQMGIPQPKVHNPPRKQKTPVEKATTDPDSENNHQFRKAIGKPKKKAQKDSKDEDEVEEEEEEEKPVKKQKKQKEQKETKTKKSKK